VVRSVVEALVRGDYSAVARRTANRRLTADEIRGAVKQYGGTSTMPPDPGFSAIDVIEVENSKPPRYAVSIDLWTVEEGSSDLTLELTIVDSDGEPLVQLDGLHVL
jgi:hypothetical protein